MDRDEQERMQAASYDAHLDSLIAGLSETDLRNLSDKIIDRLSGLEEQVPLPREVQENVRAFVEAVTDKMDSLPLPSEAEATYFLNKAKHLARDLNALAEDINAVWSWLEENEKRGRLSDERLGKLQRLRLAMYYDSGLADLGHFCKQLPQANGQDADDWYSNTGDRPQDAYFLEEYMANLY